MVGNATEYFGKNKLKSYLCPMNMNGRRYRMVFDKTNNRFVIERKVDLVLYKFWTRKYLWNQKEPFYSTDELALARRIVNILNGKINTDKV